jgi:hypothetical protein
MTNKLIVRETSPGVFVELFPFDSTGAPTLINTGTSDAPVAHSFDITSLWGDVDLNAIGIHRVDPVPLPTDGSTVTGYHFAKVGNVVMQVIDATPLTVDGLVAYAATARYNKETAGITVSGAAVTTDRASQAMLAGAFNYCQQNPTTAINWKTATGAFVTLTAAQITAIADAVGAHVQACFSKEMTVVTAIKATPPTITTTAQIDAQFAAITT